MAAVVTLPKFRAWVPSTGAPAASYVVRTFAAGTSTPLAVYTDAGLTTPAANPFVLDANGEAIVYAAAGANYKMQLYDPTNTSQQWSVDNITISGSGTSSTANDWVASGLTPTFISTTSFSFVGDQTGSATPGRRIQSSNTAGTIYSSILTSSFGGGITTVTVVNDSGVLDSGLSVMNYGPGSVNLSQPQRTAVAVSHANGTSLTSATSYNLGKDLTPTVRVDTLSEWSTGTGLFTAKAKGTYRAAVQINLTNTITTGTAGGTLNVFKNASAYAQTAFPLLLLASNANANYAYTLEAFVTLNAGDTLGATLVTPTFSAGALSTTSSQSTPVVLIQRIA